ncbi:MAG: glycerol-3-phosphate acyltransferase [Anaerolineales bacterium]|nr:glycerol-3-phosphate acyltransferase [Anaerolineales bacterium]MCZ2122374.1 glycerol-3-phosphate acyltransferase [Anaerolineales bacterium]
MQLVIYAALTLLSYVIGSIPFGLLIVKLKTGKDIREVESGRTGGTNAMRAAGFWAGFGTAMLDIAKGAVGMLIARWVSPDAYGVHVLAGLAAILGHNYSIFLAERDANGKIRLRGGAGGAPSVGGAIGIWPGALLIILPLGMLTFFTVGIASVTTMAVALFAIIVFYIRASMGLMPWVYVWFGIGAEILLIWALRPNLKKLFSGNERIVKYSLNGWLKAKREAEEAK